MENAEDIIEEIKFHLPEHFLNKISLESQQTLPLMNLSQAESQVFNLISNEPKHIDMLINQSGLKVNEVSSLLVNLELKGIIKQIAGKMFVKL